LTFVYHTDALAERLERFMLAEDPACSSPKGVEYNFALRAVKQDDAWNLGMSLVKLAERGDTTHRIVVEVSTDDNGVR
jgi:hypothetical protein